MSPLFYTRVRVSSRAWPAPPVACRYVLAFAHTIAAARASRRRACRRSRELARHGPGARKKENSTQPRERPGPRTNRCYGRINILISNIVYVRRLTQCSTGVARERPRTSEQRPRDVCDCEFRWAHTPSMSHGRLSGTFSSACRTSRRVSSGARRARLAGQSHGLATGSSVSAVPYQPARRALRSSAA